MEQEQKGHLIGFFLVYVVILTGVRKPLVKTFASKKRGSKDLFLIIETFKEDLGSEN